MRQKRRHLSLPTVTVGLREGRGTRAAPFRYCIARAPEESPRQSFLSEPPQGAHRCGGAWAGWGFLRPINLPNGYRPLCTGTGREVDARKTDVAWKTGVLDEASNAVFGKQRCGHVFRWGSYHANQADARAQKWFSIFAGAWRPGGNKNMAAAYRGRISCRS